ncbi:hypothetical protein J5Y04_20755 [Kitasatospora sp. RG8]|uniref:hypothetical protein n=1 Tax=Kitasatospora sp. RG8 TaxID=2820815 RepID=UPI001AE078F7|nr:hypothetical protein [Kitasatospora sp. RG8]MBP0451950.1 hypothetical protein [Kitasatospora sp. RG8]
MSGQDENVVARSLAGLAEGVEIGPVPYDRVLAGGRRRRLRRRSAAVGALALAVVAVAGGGVVLGAGGGGAGAATVVTAAAGSGASGAGAGQGSGAAVPSARPTATVSAAARDPFTPVRVKLAEGTSNGKAWTAWAALWPATGKDQAYQQARLIWQDQRTARPDLPEPTEDFVRQYRHEGQDLVDLYVTLDGKRLPVGATHETPAPGGEPPRATDPYGNLTGSALGPRAKDAPDPAMKDAPTVVLLQVGSDAAKLVVTLPDGTTTEPAVVTVGDSPVRWVAIPRAAASAGGNIKVYGADGALLATTTDWLR